ncbi:DUF2279 domain-containing protein [Flavobacterium sp.]|uniref:DUF2279 domain-containing protein n=1 Tax=Flavobacterium sp. TaxID=239 RepID=UPI002FDAD9EC
MKVVVLFRLLFWVGFSSTVFSQSRLDSFLRPADSLNTSRRLGVVVSEATLSTAALVGLHELWYSDYEKSAFQFKDDNNDWFQVDKAGHMYSAYHLGRFSAELFSWAGISKRDQMWYGATYGFAFLTAVEVFDGHSEAWGFSWGDVAANATGTLLYVSQELLWDEQRVVPKFSFHSTRYAAQRPELLGEGFGERLIKDYNGQTYWLSVNLHSFAKESRIPKWLNVALGYGATGMLSATAQSNSPILEHVPVRTRQFYLSLDIDLTRIETQSAFLRTLFSVFNTLKIPAPAFEINGLGQTKWHAIYF